MKYLTALIGVALCFASCSSDKSADSKDAEQAAIENDSTAVDSVAILDGEWVLTGYNAQGQPVAVDTLTACVLSISTPDSTFTIATGVNDITGKYVQNGDSLKFNNLAQKGKMAGPEDKMKVENDMTNILPTVESVQISDSVLVLMNNNQPVATFKKK